MSTRVFVVEDLPQARRALADLLTTVGDFEVVGECGNEAEAKLWLDEHRGAWDLVIVDLILEQGTGMAVVAKARQTSPTGRIAVFSDFATPGIEKHCRMLGADHVFQKERDLTAFVEFATALEPPAPQR